MVLQREKDRSRFWVIHEQKQPTVISWWFLVPDVRSHVVVNLLLLLLRLLHLASLQGIKVDFHRRDLHVTNWKEETKIGSVDLSLNSQICVRIGPELTGSFLIPSQPSSLWVALDTDDVQVLSLLQGKVGLTASVVQVSPHLVDGLQGSKQLTHTRDQRGCVCDTNTPGSLTLVILLTYFKFLSGFLLLLLSLQVLFVPVQFLVKDTNSLPKIF